MTQPLAYWVGGALLCALAADLLLTGGDTLLFLSKRLLDLVHWLAFWR